MRSTRAQNHAAVPSMLLGLLLGGQGVRAHEFWIDPVPLAPGAGEEIRVHLRVGEIFAGDEVPFTASHSVEFRRCSDGVEEDLVQREGSRPAGRFRAEAASLHLISYRSAASRIVLDAEPFHDYLLEEGLYVPLAERRRRGNLALPGRERFSRFCKAYLVGADARQGGDVAGRILGHRLEIVSETDPVVIARDGGEIELRILYERQPLAGALVTASPREAPGEGRARRLTDGEGRVRFDLDRPGAWLISLVWMVPCADCPDAEWESLWATLVVGARLGDTAPDSARR